VADLRVVMGRRVGDRRADTGRRGERPRVDTALRVRLRVATARPVAADTARLRVVGTDRLKGAASGRRPADSGLRVEGR